MSVIDVTPRPAAVSSVVRFLQSRVMSILGILFILTALKWGALLFVVHQYETVIITRFGKIVRTVTNPGLKIKLPIIDNVHRFDKRILAWDGPPTECPTKDKLYIIVDCFARWRISDPFLYYNRLNDERSALSRLDDILGSETRTAVAAHDLVEIIRVTKGRKPLRDEELEKSGTVLPSRKLLNACRVNGTRSRPVFAPKDAARRRISAAKRKATSPQSVPPQRRMPLKLKGRLTPRRLPSMPQHSVLLTRKNFIRFFGALT